MSTSANPWDLSDDELLDVARAVPSPAPAVEAVATVDAWSGSDALPPPASQAPIQAPRIPAATSVAIDPAPVVKTPWQDPAPKDLEPVAAPVESPKDPPDRTGRWKLGALAAALASVGVLVAIAVVPTWTAKPVDAPAVVAPSVAPVQAPSVPAPAAPAVEPAPTVLEAPAMEAPAVPMAAPVPEVQAPAVQVPPAAPVATPTVPSPAPAASQSKPALPPELVVPTPPSAQDDVGQLPPPPPGAAQAAQQGKKVAATTPAQPVAKPRVARTTREAQAPDGWDTAQRRMEEFLRQQGR